MAENKKSFVLYADLLRNIEHLTNEEKGMLFNHLLEYVNDLNPILEDRLLITAWKPIEAQLKRDLVKFKEVKDKRSKAGKLSAELRSKSVEHNSTKSTHVKSVEQDSTNSTDNVNDNVNDNDNVINNISLSGKPDYAHIFKGWVKFINQTFDRQFTTAAWEKKTLPKIKQLLKDYKTKENLAEALITVCKNIAKDAYHIETNFKYVTPEYIARPDIFDKHLNTISKVDAKQSERWQKPEDIYLCVDWIDKIPCPPKDLNGDEAAMFMYVWRISELMHYQQDRQGVHSNLSEHAEF